MSLANSGKRRSPAASSSLSYSAVNSALRLRALSGTSSPVRVSMIETTGSVVVLTPATSTHTELGAPPKGSTQTGSTKLAAAQSSTFVHAVVVALVPSGPLGDAHTDSTYAK